jgi:hypothetical protein
MRRGMAAPVVERSAFAGFRFPPEVIILAVRWYLRYGLSYRDVEELTCEVVTGAARPITGSRREVGGAGWASAARLVAPRGR